MRACARPARQACIFGTMPEWRDSTAGATGGWTRRGDDGRRSSRDDEDHGAALRAERRSSGGDEDLDADARAGRQTSGEAGEASLRGDAVEQGTEQRAERRAGGGEEPRAERRGDARATRGPAAGRGATGWEREGGPDSQAPAISAGDSDAGLSTIREAPRGAGSTTQGRAPGLSAAMARAGSRARRSVAPRTLALVLGAMFVGTCASVYVVSRMAKETGEPRGGEGSGAPRAPFEGASLGGPNGGSAAVALGAGPEAGGVAGAAGTGGGVERREAAGGAAGAGSGGVEWRGATGSVASGAAGTGSGGVEWRGAAEVDGSNAPVDEAAKPAGGGESLWVPVAQADGEAAERRRKIAAQARALMSEPRLLACLLGHVTIGVGRRTALTGSLVVAGDGEVVRASVRGGDRAVPAGARACVAAELEKSRFLPGPQAQLVVPLRLEIQ
ncbi:hypothetical protein [Nannocystis pusilla]|uniref:hypothetical protein n=1 Tax=Nannocystis pusilla TaxID=889268 RepID=UPI003DA3CA5F